MPSRESGASGAIEKWLSIVGVGDDGTDGLAPAARRAIEDAEFVFGGQRHLDHVAELVRGEARSWPSPFDAAVAEVVRLKGRRVCVLASGDPFHYGVGATLARHVVVDEMVVFPAPSAFSLAAARLGWPLQEAETISLHGRPIDLARPLLHPGRRIIALTSDGAAPAAVAALLTDEGFGASVLHILEAMGGTNERATTLRADEIGAKPFHPLNMLGIEVAAEDKARILPLRSGLSDDLFEHDGQLTKQEIRAVTLAALAPRSGELLWDVGAGSGSISIEWMLAHPSMRAIAIEPVAERAERIRANARRCGVPSINVMQERAPEALSGLPTPDAVFIGGGGSEPGVIDMAISALPAGGRLVANAVTVEMEGLLAKHYAERGGRLLRIALSRAGAIGTKIGWRPAMPVTQWSWVKP